MPVTLTEVIPLPSAEQITSLVEKEVSAYLAEELEAFKRAVMNDELGLAPKQTGGGAPLYRYGRYIRSWKITRRAGGWTVGPTGMNLRISNAALGELLEYGHGNSPPRPHMRILTRKVLEEGPDVVMERVADELRRSF